MATIAVPSAGDPVKASWGTDVAQAINNTHDDRLPFLNAMGVHASTNQVDVINLAAVSAGSGGCAIIPFHLPIGMDLVSYSVWQNSTSGARAAEARLYKDTGSTTLTEVADSDAAWSFTPSAANIRTASLTSGNLYLSPGLYWLAIRNTDTSNAFVLGSGSNTADWSATTNDLVRNGSSVALASTLDVSSFTGQTKPMMARLNGAVFGESTAF